MRLEKRRYLIGENIILCGGRARCNAPDCRYRDIPAFHDESRFLCERRRYGISILLPRHALGKSIKYFSVKRRRTNEEK